MGKQQILLLTLTVILVNVAVTAGLNLLRQNAIASHQDEVISRMNSLAAEAIHFKLRPVSMGGGGGDFAQFLPTNATSFGPREDDGPNRESHFTTSTNTGFMLEAQEVNYFVEIWPMDTGYTNARIKIIASSKKYGEGNFWDNRVNARIIIFYNTKGHILEEEYQSMKGITITGDW